MGVYGFSGEDLKRMNDGRHRYDPAAHAILPAGEADGPEAGDAEMLDLAECHELMDAANREYAAED